MKEEVAFYQSKRKNTRKAIFSLIFVILFLMVGLFTYQMLPTVSFLLFFIAFIFLCVFVFFIRNTAFSVPWIILTEDSMILNPDSLNKAEIKWEDISGFRIEYIYFRLHIHIGLFDEAKYGFKKDAIFRGFNILWDNLSEKDQTDFIEEVNRYTPDDVNDLNTLFEQEEARKKAKQTINFAYFLRGYVISLFITIGLWYVFDFWDHTIYYYIYFMIYPFAKVAYDRFIGFMILYRLDHESRHMFMSSSAYLAPPLCWFIVYLIGPILAPVGLIMLISLHRQAKKNDDS